jgi:ribonuclease HI
MVQGPLATLHFDGASRGNPGPSGAGALLRFEASPRAEIAHPLPFDATNNVAEYAGLILGLRAALDAGVGELHVFGDSELVVRQVAGQYRVTKLHLVPLHAEALRLRRLLGRVRIASIPREQNAEADALSQQAADLAAKRPRQPYAEWLASVHAGGPLGLQ